MAKKSGNYYECENCGHQEAKWSGKCQSCGEWNTMSEQQPISTGAVKGLSGGSATRTAARTAPELRPLHSIELKDEIRLESGLRELDRVLGGGVLRGSSVLLGGEPGIGKSTLMLQAAASYARIGKVLYISGEEAAAQIKLRADRLGVGNSKLNLLNSSMTEDCAASIFKLRPAAVVVDSVQTLMSGESAGAPGSPNQIKFSVQILAEAARSLQSAIFFIAHVTKEGAIAGPKLMEHLVDAVLYFDQSDNETRYIRSTKNRFGSTEEIGLFNMDHSGLHEVSDPSELFISRDRPELPPGTAIVPIYEGSRVLMVEIQALTVPGNGGYSRVYSDKIDQRRVSRVAAVLEKHLNLRFSDQDIYVNVAGGIKIQDVGTELALAMALYSARTGLPLPARSALCGEVSLSGRLRPVGHLKKRSIQALELGFSPVLVPKFSGEPNGGSKPSGVQTMTDLSQAVRTLFEKPQ